MAQSAGDSLGLAKKTSISGTSVMNLAGSKLRKQLSSSLQESASAPTSAFAVKQLEKMGWTEGTGLGKKRNGITTHIKVKRRIESAGLGTEKQGTEKLIANETWWKDSVGDTLAKLSSKSKKKKSKRRKEFTDEELFEATGGARFGMRAVPTRNLAKWRRTETEVIGTNSAVAETVPANYTHAVDDNIIIANYETIPGEGKADEIQQEKTRETLRQKPEIFENNKTKKDKKKKSKS
jgi:hypothetical protein